MFRREVRYLGWVVLSEGSKIDPVDTIAVRALKDKQPTTVGELSHHGSPQLLSPVHL